MSKTKAATTAKIKTAKVKDPKKAATKKGVAKKAAPKKKTVKKKAAAKKTAGKTNKRTKKITVSLDEKRMMVALHAYYKWENAGRPDNSETQHWFEAEKEIEKMLG